MEKKIEDMTVKELRVEAKNRGFKNISKLKKPALVEALTFEPDGYDGDKPVPASPSSKPKRTKRAPIKEAVGEIQKGVPIPKEQKRGKYPIEDLQPGESFLVECPQKNAKKVRLNIMGAARRVAKKCKRTFVVEVRWPDEKGVRCWRTDSVDKIVGKPKKPATKKKAAPEKAPEKPIELTEEVQVDEGQGEAAEQLPLPAPVEAPETPSFKLPI